LFDEAKTTNFRLVQSSFDIVEYFNRDPEFADLMRCYRVVDRYRGFVLHVQERPYAAPEDLRCRTVRLLKQVRLRPSPPCPFRENQALHFIHQVPRRHFRHRRKNTCVSAIYEVRGTE
jgi:hypothetical protein